MNFLVPIEETTISFILAKYKEQDEKHRFLIRAELNKIFVERQVPLRLDEVGEQRSKTQDVEKQSVSKKSIENFSNLPFRISPNFLNIQNQQNNIKQIDIERKDDLPKGLETRFLNKLFNNTNDTLKSNTIKANTDRIPETSSKSSSENFQKSNTINENSKFNEPPKIQNFDSNLDNNINNKSLFNFLLSINKNDKSNNYSSGYTKSIEQNLSIENNNKNLNLNLPKPNSGLAELIDMGKELSNLEEEKRLMIEQEAESNKTREEKNRKIKEIQDKYDQIILSRSVEIDMYNNEVIKYVKSVMDWETWDNVYNERINRLEIQMKDIKKSITNILENNKILSEANIIELDYFDKSLHELIEESRPENLLRYIIRQFKEEKIYQLDYTQLSKNNYNFEDIGQDDNIYGFTDSMLDGWEYDSENEFSMDDTSTVKPATTYINKNTDFYQMLANNTTLDFGKLQFKSGELEKVDNIIENDIKDSISKKEINKPKFIKREKLIKQNSENRVSPPTPKEIEERSDRSKSLKLQKSEPLTSPRSNRNRRTVEITNPISISSLNQLEPSLLNAIKHTAKPTKYSAKVTLMFVKFKDNMENQNILSDINFITKKLDDIIKVKDPIEIPKGQIIYKGRFFAYNKEIISVIIDLDAKLLRKIVRIPPTQKELLDFLVIKDTNINFDEKFIKELNQIL